VIASHYAEPLHATLACDTPLRERPAEDSAIVAQLAKGDGFDLLDNTLGWAWGYAGSDRRVGYVRSEALAG
jgi:hypothetical protein